MNKKSVIYSNIGSTMKKKTAPKEKNKNKTKTFRTTVLRNILSITKGVWFFKKKSHGKLLWTYFSNESFLTQKLLVKLAK